MKTAPVDAKRYVQVGVKVFENFVTELSIFLPVITSSPKNKVFVALDQLRLAFAAELLITLEIFPVLATLTIIPSRRP